MSEWKEYKLNELIDQKKAELQTGPFGTMLSASEYSTDGIPVIAVQDIGDNKLEYHKFVFVNDKVANRLSRYRVKENDIIFGRKGATDRRAIIKKKEEGWLQGSDCIRLRLDNSINSKFVSYQLGSKYFKEWMLQFSVGATMPSLNQEILKLLPLRIPHIEYQNNITEILSSLDDKIDLLHRQNKTLEQLAETLFRQWFVEEAEESWEETTLGEIAEIKAGGDKPKVYSKTKTEECYIPVYSNGIDNEGLYGYTDTARIFIESITVSARGTIGFVCLRLEPYVPIVRLISIIPNDNYMSSKYLYLWAKAQNISGTGTTQEQLTVPDFSSTTLLLPPLDKMKEFTNFVDGLFQKIKSNTNQIITLTRLRDTLLPKLMSGEVNVN